MSGGRGDFCGVVGEGVFQVITRSCHTSCGTNMIVDCRMHKSQSVDGAVKQL